MIRVLTLALFLTACGGGGGDNTPSTPTTPTYPQEGTRLSTECDGYTEVIEYADGSGGSYLEEVEQSFECGWEEPVLDVEVVNASGDRYEPVEIKVSYTQFGEYLEWPFEVTHTIGHLKIVDEETVHIFGDGRLGEGVLDVDGEQYFFNFIEEPRCAKPETTAPYDCQNYFYSGPSKGYIYYGEDDDRMVDWEIAILIYTSEDAQPDSYNRTGIIEEYEEGSDIWNKWQRKIDKYNLAYERSGVYIRYVLKYVVSANYGGNSGVGPTSRDLPVDIALGWGSTCDAACGCAYVNKRFYEGRPLGSTSNCGWDTDLHEVGHSVGLAHGPNNSFNQARGYIWSDFGHGANNVFCGALSGDIMSYYSNTPTHFNSKLTCGEMFGAINSRVEPDNEDPAGSRDYADAAYHLNRVRYDVSLINRENDWEPPADYPLQFIKVEAQEKGRILVID